MTDTMTSQNIVLSSWDTLYIIATTLHLCGFKSPGIRWLAKAECINLYFVVGY
jgi:hypothetical protein